MKVTQCACTCIPLAALLNISFFLNTQYKDEIPKPPLTPYMMFMQTKQPKVKRKYPDLLMTEVATKIGEWLYIMSKV